MGLYCSKVMRFSGIHGMVCISNSLGCGSLMVVLELSLIHI